MAKIKKKGESGAATNFISRNQALKKLQITLADFRRLCILKGIFPREPRNKKKANKGSTAPRTFYYTKDISYLLHEPILEKLREHKTFLKKINKAIGKGQQSVVKSLEEQKPEYTLDHVIKERYPTFVDALRDLDDALALIALFANLAVSEKVDHKLIERCRTVLAEWQHIVVDMGALRKVFLSIKGIYYQVDVKGQEITWITPWRFCMPVPDDVDLRVLLTFLEFYLSLLEFVNYKLYTDNNLVYPPKVHLEDDRGIGWLDIQHEKRGEVVKELSSRIPSNPASTQTHAVDKVSSKKLETLQSKMQDIVKGDDEDDMVVDESDRLFSKCSFWLNRETPISSLLFVLKAFGAKLVAFDDSETHETDPRITHQIVDRDYSKAKRILERVYVQPQWVFDCINQGKLLDHADYVPGVALPPHLSPFVVGADRHGYTPMVELGQRADLGEDSDVEPKEKVQKLLQGKDVTSAHALHQLDMEAEELGIDDAEIVAAVEGKKKSKANKQEQERKEMAKAMMSRRDRRLYERMTFSNEKKSEAAEKLEKRRKEISKKKAKQG